MHLQGRLILDCSALLPGPFIGKLMVLRGARVIKIENPLRPDGAKEMGAFYDDLNDRKEKLPLNLMDSTDRVRFRELVQQADGLIEGFRPQAKKKLGLDEITLHQINPHLCILSLVGYPEEGPWKDRAGHDLNFAAVTGCASLFHEMPALPLADLFSAYEGAFALACALDSVARGSLGSRTVVSMTETLKNVQSGLMKEYEASQVLPLPGETLFSGKFPCYRIYSTADHRRVSVGAIEPKFWQKVCEILQVTHLSGEGYAVKEKGKNVIAEIQNVFATKNWAEWAPVFESADCCVEPILNYSEVYSSGI
jgi:alpha-methylacyl-CoA racemase